MKRIVALAAALALVPAAALASNRVWVTAKCTSTSYKPKQIVIACGDANEYVAKIHWKTWGTRTATGTGTVFVNDCTPDCARGKFHGTAATLTLSRPISCKHQRHRVFKWLALHFPKVQGKLATERDPIGCPVS